ncbi:YbaB/EbfC family nucleoid-associated protein [Gordonia sp. NPDC003424]
MDIPRTADDVAPLLDTMSSLLSEMATIREKAIQLTATATELDGRLRVTVNAKGLVIDTVVDEDALATVTASRLGAAFTAATQRAAQDVAQQSQELWAPAIEKQQALPRATDILDGLPDFGSFFAAMPEPPTTAPGEADDEVYVEIQEQPTHDDSAPHYEELHEPDERRSTFTDRAW